MAVLGPEGAGKTTTIFKVHDKLVEKLAIAGESELVMYAFADYDAAYKKCAAFNAEQIGNGFKGVVLPSFSRAYEEACEECGVQRITKIWAARNDYNDLLEAIEELQPKVIEVFKRRHKEIWASIGTSRPAFFVVHQTLHVWIRNSTTRLMWSPSYWDDLEDLEPKERLLLLRKEMTLGLAVHDEVKVSHIVEMWPVAKVHWVKKLVASNLAIWRERSALIDRLESFEQFLAEHGSPKINDRPVDITFDEATEIVAFSQRDWDRVVVRDSGEYRSVSAARADDGEEREDIYEDRHGREWHICEREWWLGLAHQVVLLTTEAVPIALARRCTSSWCVFELHAPLLPKNVVQVHAKRSVNGQKLALLCSEFRSENPDYFIVSNKVKMLADTMPHITARGSNELIGRNVLQTMTFITPVQYEELQVLNAWTGRSDLVGLNHVDEFNQTAGRNLGFRWQDDAKHVLLINRRLFKLLSQGKALGHARYQWETVLDKHQRSDMGTRH